MQFTAFHAPPSFGIDPQYRPSSFQKIDLVPARTSRLT